MCILYEIRDLGVDSFSLLHFKLSLSCKCILQLHRPPVNSRFYLCRTHTWWSVTTSFATHKIPISISELADHQVDAKDVKPWECSLQLMKICLEIASLNESLARNWLIIVDCIWFWTKSIFPSALSSSSSSAT